MIRNLKFWWYRKRHGVPSHQEIRSFMPFKTTPGLTLVAKLYGLYGMSLNEVAEYLGDPKNRPQRDPVLVEGGPRVPAKNFSLLLIFRPTTRERIRQIVWKLWRIGRVDRNV